jgi:hypothetical protein
LTVITKDHQDSDYYLLSALAEGSDQLVARIAQKIQRIKLIVPLPLPEERYLLDFQTVEGRNTFNQLLKTAVTVITLTDSDNHVFAYDYLGSYLVDQCAALIAIWNGEHSNKRGSTGQVIKRAINAGKPVYWVYCENGNAGSVNNLSQEKKVGEIQVLHPSN